MTLTRYCLFVLVALLSHPLVWAEDRWVEGQHYKPSTRRLLLGAERMWW
ncbi:MAG: hypothetical protein CM15mP74_14020 [Halieaceae bacterium]|nr:MAG: hypothetical protein CM15mP74_14020 [Halieaceae bacterium]